VPPRADQTIEGRARATRMSRPGRWWRHLRRRGLLAAGSAFVDRFVYHSYRCVITYNAAAGPPAVDHVGDVTFRAAIPSDLERLEELDRYGRGATHRHHVEEGGDWLVVACDGERIVATQRASRVIRDRVISRVLRLAPDQFWAADIFCLPEYRNRGIGRHLQVFGDRYGASLGYKERFGSVPVTNTASLRASRAAGRQPVCYLSFRRILFWERLRVSKNVPRRYWDALPGADGRGARCGSR
jgi:GNAT superfamily N-acetyltransferase